jgi:23S rRNA (adenine2503-C2)-methyltransferase
MKIIKQVAALDGTTKRLHELSDGEVVESVLIPHKTKTNLCISTQAGCRMRCAFCASGRRFGRNLTASEILGQADVPVNSVVLMGMGEPLDNPNIFEAIELLKKEKCIPSRKIVVSTAGIYDRMALLLPTKVNIAVSLNATTQEQRQRIMPIARKYSLEELGKAMQEINEKLPSRRRLQVEYVMIKGFNDSISDAKRFAGLVPAKSLINLIPVNPNSAGFEPPEMETVIQFKEELRRQGYVCYVREARGKDVSAACGMLAGKK